MATSDRNTDITANDRFNGDFDSLPLSAHIRFGAVPQFPTESDFHLAVSDAITARHPAAEWRVEAIRFRRQNPGATLDAAKLKLIARATAQRLYDRRGE
jgi:hypothetical protein